MDKFVRGARVGGGSRVMQIAESISAERPLSLGQIIYVLMDVRRKHNGEVTKEQLLGLISKAWDAYDEASKAFPADGGVSNHDKD